MKYFKNPKWTNRPPYLKTNPEINAKESEQVAVDGHQL